MQMYICIQSVLLAGLEMGVDAAGPHLLSSRALHFEKVISSALRRYN
jgi:hypothetical protein